MAPIPDSAYFPSLDKLFEKGELLISWKTASYVLLHSNDFVVAKSSALDSFFSDPVVLELLAHPLKAFSAPNQHTKSAFETKTSAINVTPSSDTRYDIKEVKEDALWLSKETRIDEVSALRIVVVECQDRPSARLLGRLSNEEAINIEEAAGASQAAIALLSRYAESNTARDDFNSQESRRIRLIRTYLSERRSILQCLNLVFQAHLYPVLDGSGSGKGKDAAEPISWLHELGNNIWQKLGDQEKWIIEGLSVIRVDAENMDRGSGWFQADGGREDIEAEYLNTQLVEICHTMEVIFQLIDNDPDPSSSTIVIAWLEAMEQYGFFDEYLTDDSMTAALFSAAKSAAAITSLRMLSPSSCIEFLRTTDVDARVSPDAPQNHPYILNLTTVEHIHQRLMRVSNDMCNNAAPMVLAWADILQTLAARVRTFEEEANNYGSSGDVFGPVVEKMLTGLPDDTVDVIQYLASSAVDRGSAFQTLTDLGMRLGGTTSSYFSFTVGSRMRVAILDLIESSGAVGYIPELVEACLSALIGGRTYWDVLDAQQPHPVCDASTYFLSNPGLLSEILASAKNRFPYETALLKFVRALSTCYGTDGRSIVPLLLQEIETIETFTCPLPDDFGGYTTTQEDENNNSIRLTVPLHLFEEGIRTRALQRSKSALVQVNSDFIIPNDTLGRMILDSPKVAYWNHQYSGLKYFGKLLETFLAAGEVINAIIGGPVDRESVADIIGTFAGLLLGCQKASEIDPDSATDFRDEARHHLETASSGMGPNRDIVSVVFEIFEEELQRQSTAFGADVSLDVLVSCVQFIHASLPIYSSRVWALLGRSGLIELGRGGGKLSKIVGSVEMVSGRFDLLLSCTHLYEALVDDFVSQAARRRNLEKSVVRFGKDQGQTGRAAVGHFLPEVLLSFTRYFVNVLESSSSWKFTVQDDRRQLSRTVTRTFDRVLRYAYGIDSQLKTGTETEFKKAQVLFEQVASPYAKQDAGKKPKPSIMGALLPAASHIVESFLSTSSGTLRFRPLLETLRDGFHHPPSTTFVNKLSLCVEQVTSTLFFSTTVLRCGVLLGRPHSQLESQLFRTSPLLTRLYAVHDAYRQPVVSLLEALITSASRDSVEPPSLLGYLGTQTSKDFVYVLADLDKPMRRQACTAAIWQFLAVILSNRQQWFANCLLTGRDSKRVMSTKEDGEKIEKESAPLDRPLLDTALESLSRINTLFKPDALAMLEFVALAQNFWPWAAFSSAKHPVFIKAISEYVGSLKPIQPSSKLADSIDACYQTRIAAFIAEILAMHLFHARQTGNKVPARDLLPNLDYFLRFAVAVPSYNSSLHGNLKRNFEARYPGCSLLDFERTALEQRPLGTGYFYNQSILNQALSYDKNWRRADGLSTEIATANINLSLVDAQIALLHGWTFLATELSIELSDQPALQQKFAKMSAECLKSNRQSQGLEEIFRRLNQRRADLALVLIQRLIESKMGGTILEGLLDIVWETIQQSETSFERALLAGNVEYYRTLLKVLFLALRVHADAGEAGKTENTGIDFKSSTRFRNSSPVIAIAIAVLESVVANGIRDLSAMIHDKRGNPNPEDIALITGILQACLRIPGIEFCYPQIVSMFNLNDSAQIAASLYSWSDTFAIEGDPVYGELSMLFLLELSTIPPMAEQLAIDGLLSQISGANITGYLRRAVFSRLTDNIGDQRCYNIWVKGILPLVLNILSAVGEAIGTEVALFIGQFPNLLKQSSESFDTPETSRTVPKGKITRITLSMCSEVHSLSLIMYILHGFRNSDGGLDIPDVKWDLRNVLDGADYWLNMDNLLKQRTLPMGERAAWTRRVNGTSVLDGKVRRELMGIKTVLTEIIGGA